MESKIQNSLIIEGITNRIHKKPNLIIFESYLTVLIIGKSLARQIHINGTKNLIARKLKIRISEIAK